MRPPIEAIRARAEKCATLSTSLLPDDFKELGDYYQAQTLRDQELDAVECELLADVPTLLDTIAELEAERALLPSVVAVACEMQRQTCAGWVYGDNDMRMRVLWAKEPDMDAVLAQVKGMEGHATERN